MLTKKVAQILDYENNLEILSRKHHNNCIFYHDVILIERSFDESGNLTGTFRCDDQYQGYDGIVHGGVLSAIVDSVMTQCLFGNGYAGYTARLDLKFRNPVKTGGAIKVHSNIITIDQDKVIHIRASIFQDGVKSVTADARFWIFDIL